MDKKEKAKENFLKALNAIRQAGVFSPTLIGLLELAGYPEEAHRDKGLSPMYNGRQRISMLPDHLRDALNELLNEGKIELFQDTFFFLPQE